MHPPALLVYLDAVARAGSIRKAAEGLHVASTALNRRILNLEEELGTPVFERLPSGVRLSAAGEIFMAYVRSSLSDLSSAVSRIEQLRGLVRGEVQIAAAESVTLDLLPQAMAAFQARHPGVGFRVRSGGTEALLEHLLSDACDLLLAHDPPESEALDRLAEVPQPLCALLRPDHPLAGRDAIRLADCAPYPVALGEATFGGRRLIDRVLAATRLKLNVTLVASSVQSMAAYTRQTGAISFQFAVGTRHEVRRGDLLALPLTDRAFGRARLVLAARRGRTLPIAALRFAEVLKASLAGAV
ncbi:LysR family transcriptional regulator [Ramlibacter sp. CGMCC 1.13660]|nr:LysR family transcriptional regulator [Ramlibacter sp. CGMCC 1.13660]